VARWHLRREQPLVGISVVGTIAFALRVVEQRVKATGQMQAA
jgi:hypothetical protein